MLLDPAHLAILFGPICLLLARKYGIVEDPMSLAVVVSPLLVGIVALLFHKTAVHTAAIRMGARLGVFALVAFAAGSLVVAAPARAQAFDLHLTSGVTTAAGYQLDGGRRPIAVGYQVGADVFDVMVNEQLLHFSVNGAVFAAGNVSAAVGVCIVTFACGWIFQDLDAGKWDTSTRGFMAGIFVPLPDLGVTSPARRARYKARRAPEPATP
jgi:hypothetical protein